MTFDWRILREPAPMSLAGSRQVAHYAVQWVARAAVANLPAAPDDSHSALAWDATRRALVSAALPGGVTVGLQLESLELLVTRNAESERLALHGLASSVVDDWLASKLTVRGCNAHSEVKLPYAVRAQPLSREPGLAALSRWYGAAADVLEAVRAKYGDMKPGPGPVRCWPHHFDIALLVRLEEGAAESVRSIGVGCSPGDEYYPEPYFYVSPYPAPKNPTLPGLPPGGHWHTKDFLGGVASAQELLALPESSRCGNGGHRRSVRSGTRMARRLRKSASWLTSYVRGRLQGCEGGATSSSGSGVRADRLRRESRLSESEMVRILSQPQPRPVGRGGHGDRALRRREARRARENRARALGRRDQARRREARVTRSHEKHKQRTIFPNRHVRDRQQQSMKGRLDEEFSNPGQNCPGGARPARELSHSIAQVQEGQAAGGHSQRQRLADRKSPVSRRERAILR